MAHCWRPKILGAVRNVSLSAFEGLFRCCFFVEPFFLLGASRGGALGSLRFVNCCGMGHDMPCPIFAEDLDAEATNFDTKIAEWVHGQSLLHVHVDAFLIFCIFLCSFQIVPPRLFEASSTCQVHCLPTSFGGSCSTCAALDGPWNFNWACVLLASDGSMGTRQGRWSSEEHGPQTWQDCAWFSSLFFRYVR